MEQGCNHTSTEGLKSAHIGVVVQTKLHHFVLREASSFTSRHRTVLQRALCDMLCDWSEVCAAVLMFRLN